jgi:hypothetical protein
MRRRCVAGSVQQVADVAGHAADDQCPEEYCEGSNATTCVPAEQATTPASTATFDPAAAGRPTRGPQAQHVGARRWLRAAALSDRRHESLVSPPVGGAGGERGGFGELGGGGGEVAVVGFD